MGDKRARANRCGLMSCECVGMLVCIYLLFVYYHGSVSGRARHARQFFIEMAICGNCGACAASEVFVLMHELHYFQE